MTYRRIAVWSDLPGAGPKAARETYELDFKDAAPDGSFACEQGERAKDMAAFANVYGGVVLVGVNEKADTYDRAMLLAKHATHVAKGYEDAARDFLVPRPIVDPVVLSAPDGVHALVAVNVDPYPDQLVAALYAANSEAWRYPVRTASRHTKCINPETAMLYANPKVRKAVVLLSRVPANSTVGVQLGMAVERVGREPTSRRTVLAGKLGRVDVEANYLEIALGHSPEYEIQGNPKFRFPLEDVAAVWNQGSWWYVSLTGSLVRVMTESGGRQTHYHAGAL